jgi:hypothetical protein
MRLFPRKRRGWLVAAFIGFALVLVWQFTPYPRGMLMAYIDHRLGHHEKKVYGGLAPPWVVEGERLLKEKYGVTVTSVGSCCVSDSAMSYADGYNAVSVPRLIQKFGHDIFEECYTLARER